VWGRNTLLQPRLSSVHDGGKSRGQPRRSFSSAQSYRAASRICSELSGANRRAAEGVEDPAQGRTFCTFSLAPHSCLLSPVNRRIRSLSVPSLQCRTVILPLLRDFRLGRSPNGPAAKQARPRVSWCGPNRHLLLRLGPVRHPPCGLRLYDCRGILMPPWVNCAGVFLQASFGVPLRGTVSPV
jgi:hypothetical protein